MYMEDAISTYIDHLVSKANGMRMWAMNGYGGMGVRADKESATDGIFDLFAGNIWKAGSKVTNTNDIDDSCTCELHDQVVVRNKILHIPLGEFPIRDVERNGDRVYFTIDM